MNNIGKECVNFILMAKVEKEYRVKHSKHYSTYDYGIIGIGLYDNDACNINDVIVDIVIKTKNNIGWECYDNKFLTEHFFSVTHTLYNKDGSPHHESIVSTIDMKFKIKERKILLSAIDINTHLLHKLFLNSKYNGTEYLKMRLKLEGIEFCEEGK